MATDEQTDLARMKAVLVVTSATIFAVAPFLTPPFTGYAPEQLPIPQIDPPIQPAGYAFSIWGVIYAWLLASSVYGLVRRSDDGAWDKTRWPLIVSLVIGATWLTVAGISPVWATILIWAMLLTALLALLRAPRADRWWLQAPLALYTGWLTAASFVSLGSVAAGYGIWTGSVGWAYLGLIGALVLAWSILRNLPHVPEYAVAVIWALVGVVVANGTGQLGVSVVALGGAFALAAVAWTGLRRA